MRMHRREAMVRVAGAAAWPLGVAGAQPRRGTTPGMSAILHVVVTGHLESAKLGSEVVAALGESQAYELVVLELGVRRWRVDLVRMLARAVHRLEDRCVVYLPGEVGVGALNVGLCASICAAGPEVSVVHGPGDHLEELMSLDAPELEQAERDLAGLLWMGLRRRGVEPEVSNALATLESGVWGREEDDRIVLSGEPGGRVLIDRRADGAVSAKLDERTLVQARLVDLPGVSVTQLCTQLATGTPRIERKRFFSGLGGAEKQVTRSLEEADRLLREIEAGLDRLAKPGDDRTVPVSAFRAGGARALRELERASAALERGEAAFESYPELLRLPAPWGTPVGRTPERNVSDWRNAFLERRRRVERLKERAEDYAGR